MIDKMNQFHINLQSEQIEQLYRYYQMLIETNKVMNLTAITKYEEVVTKHFIDSLAIIELLDMKTIESIIDVGTGAGFPGLPLKIVFPQIKITLMDSLNKRIIFLQQVKEDLQLTEIEVIHSRAEDLARVKEQREKYDLAVSRAVANLSTLSEYCIPFLKKGGSFIAYKAKDVTLEIEQAGKAIKLLGGKVETCKQFYIIDQNEEFERTLIQIKKIQSTPHQFPRKAGTPSTNPL